MRTKSLFGVKSITNLIYGLLMIAPFVAILSRVIYVQANPNAKDSYSNQMVQSMSNYNNINQLSNNLQINVYKHDTNGSNSSYFYGFKSINLDLETLTGTTTQYNAINFLDDRRIQVIVYDWVNQQSSNLYRISNIDDTNVVSFVSDGHYYTSSSQLVSNAWDFKFVNYTTIKLDNAFEYSLSSFTQDNDIGVINFFGWFEGMFLNQSNAHNMVYLNFANWYMNYALLVSSSYLLFLALIWFVNYIRRILDKSMNHDFGGF